MNKFNWNLWTEYSDKTKQEKKWGIKMGKELCNRGILPCVFVLDVGCNTGEFANALNKFTPRVEGLDAENSIKNKNIKFHHKNIEKYEGEKPNVLIFKQSFHLIKNKKTLLKKYSDSFIIIAQMAKPFWCKNNKWNRIKDVENFLKKDNRDTEVLNLELHYKITPQLLKKMFIEGYTSDLQRMDKKEKEKIWEMVKIEHKKLKFFPDKLDWIIASPQKKKPFIKNLYQELLWLMNLK